MYKNILVAIDFSEESKKLLEKSIQIAKKHEAKLYLVHVNVNFSELYNGLINIDFKPIQNGVAEESQKAFEELTKDIDYPIEKYLLGMGDLTEVVSESIASNNIDLLVMGHHQDFWSKIFSSSKQLLGKTKIDMLVVPLI